MDLYIAEERPRVDGGGGDLRGIEMRVQHRLPARDPVRIGVVEYGRVEVAGDGTAAEKGGFEANPFLFREGDEGQRIGESDAVAAKLGNDCDGEKNAESAVIAATVDDCVVVRAGEKSLFSHDPTSDDVTHRVDLDFQAGTQHPVPYQGGSGAVSRR